MIDSTIVRARGRSARRPKKAGEDQAIGDRAGVDAEIHALVDALGNPVNFFLTAGGMIWSAPTTSCPRCKPTR